MIYNEEQQALFFVNFFKKFSQNIRSKSNEKSIAENTVNLFSKEDLTFKRPEGMSDKEYTRNIVEFEQELAEKKRIIIVSLQQL